jgi:cephalosporin hydroxylase
MDSVKLFKKECRDRIRGYTTNMPLMGAATDFMRASTKAKYSYNFTWLGRPIIQYPQDIVAMQEIIWRVRPDLVIETGIAHGGSLVFYASMLSLLGNNGRVVGVDIDIRAHNRKEIESHPLSNRIDLLQGSSTDLQVIERIEGLVNAHSTVLVVLDSNHTYEHVATELRLYTPFVSVGSYCVVFDTIIEFVPSDTYPDRSWGIGNNPMTAVKEFLNGNNEFVVDIEFDRKLLISVAPGGFLKRVR